MSCNGCRVLRKGCSEGCVLRSCLQWIPTPQGQAHATLFLAKFFGRSDLLSFVSAVPEAQRPALFQSLLYEACGRTVNPVDGAVGLLWSGKWRVCEEAVENVLAGGVLRPVAEGSPAGNLYPQHPMERRTSDFLGRLGGGGGGRRRRGYAESFWKEEMSSSSSSLSGMTMSFESGGREGDHDDDDRRRRRMRGGGEGETKLLNLFV